MDKKETIHEQILKLEEKLFKPKIRQSELELSKLLADNFVEFGSSGKIFDKQAIINALKQETTISISLTDFQTTLLAPKIVLATYRAKIISHEGKNKNYSQRSSIWSQIDGSWQMVFHQGTPIPMP